MSAYNVQSTAGAVPVRNKKGEITMQKVKVQRYVQNKEPEYARHHNSSDDSADEDFISHRHRGTTDFERRHSPHDRSDGAQSSSGDEHAPVDDPRLRRLQAISTVREELDRERKERHRRIHEPEFVQSDSSEDEEDENADEQQSANVSRTMNKITLASESDTDSDVSDTEIEKRRLKLRERMLQQQREEEVLKKEDEKVSEPESELESTEYEEETESEEENEPRLKPVFVRKRDRVTIQEKEREAEKQKLLEQEAKQAAKDRRRETLRLVEDSMRKELEKPKNESAEPSIDDVCTDDDDDEVVYEAWKLRELKRMKRDREERAIAEREQLEIERWRNMTEEERRQELRSNPKVVTNKASKGKYKFLQKYYHRGAFYLDQEQDVLKRNFAQPTLEDHFDKTILPKVMQVKNFGRCGRTKYTHLVDQDTTKFDSPWYSETPNNIKFHAERSGGMKQIFDRPSASKRSREK